MEHEPHCTGTKVCSICQRALPTIFFAAHHEHKDGLSAHCRVCESEAGKVRKRTKRAAARNK